MARSGNPADAAQSLIEQTSRLLPRIKTTELLMDVDDWTGFTRHFVHLKTGRAFVCLSAVNFSLGGR